jgi:Eco57I restriction-modification methylase
MSYLTSEAKTKLSSTIRELRTKLLDELHKATTSAYRLDLPQAKAGLSEEYRLKRLRLESWLDEQVRGDVKGKKDRAVVRERILKDAEKLAAATFLNRLVVIRHMEALNLIRPALLTGGWKSKAYREFIEYAPELLSDESEGFGVLLQLVFDELAQELPGLFGDIGITSLIPIPASTLRATVEALDHPILQNAWLDDTTLGWVYQYWNDPEREALDDKLNAGGKVEPHEIASKTQMFTERYMVEWLLHNSLGQIWLAMCKRNGWTAEVEADGTLARLEQRRIEWRALRELGSEHGGVALDALMPIETEAENRWKYWVPQPLTDAAVLHAPETLRTIKILDPACGSGHFLVIGCELLFALYQEESRHRGEPLSDREIIESILENNLYGVDLDPRAVQIAAAALFLKARSLCRDASPHHLNLVASNLQLASLADDDLALVELRREITESTGIPEELTNRIVHALKGADYLGTLLKIDSEVEEAIQEYETESRIRFEKGSQGDVFEGFAPQQVVLPFTNAKASLLDKLETFLSRHTSGDDLGLRLRGEQLAAGIRFIRIVREDAYNLVIGNPPYQGSSKMADSSYIEKKYPKGKADLYAAFLERGLQLAQEGGISALLTMRNWMFIKQFSNIREFLLGKYDLRILGDLDQAAFEFVKDSEVLTVVMCVFSKSEPAQNASKAIRWIQDDERVYDNGRTDRKIAAFLSQAKQYEFYTDRFGAIKEKPIIYWWDDEFLRKYAETPKLGDETDVKQGMATANNTRFLRKPWEVDISKIYLRKTDELYEGLPRNEWVPYIKGAEGKAWFEPLSDILRWEPNALQVKLFERDGKQASRPQNEEYYFLSLVAFPSIGNIFSARRNFFRSVFGNAGLSVFPEDINNTTCFMNSRLAKIIIASLNPTVNFLAGDVQRLPMLTIENSNQILRTASDSFCANEFAREASVDFKLPCSSAWMNYAQDWTQRAVDRKQGELLPEYEPVYEKPQATNYVSFAIGVALGRFGANGEGVLNEAPSSALPYGILYVSSASEKDSFAHPACKVIGNAWEKYGASIAKNASLRNWLRLNFFKDVHLNMYEKRPIYFPLSSANKNFVAFISIHRWTDSTLQDLLAEYLFPELSQMEGQLEDILKSRTQTEAKQQSKSEENFAKLKKQNDELKDFIALIQRCAEQGSPPAKSTDMPREVDAKYQMDLDDGVMINSAALWPLLEPQWSQPKSWWSELCNAKGKKDYDWSHLAARYFPNRVDEKCQNDPSLAVAHGCFWKYYPKRAFQWELRLKDEIGADFTIDEKDSDALRQEFEDNNPEIVIELKEAEEKRRERKRKKNGESDEEETLFDLDTLGEEE